MAQFKYKVTFGLVHRAVAFHPRSSCAMPSLRAEGATALRRMAMWPSSVRPASERVCNRSFWAAVPPRSSFSFSVSKETEREREKRAGTGPQITLLPRGGLDNPELPFLSLSLSISDRTAAILMVMALGLLRER